MDLSESRNAYGFPVADKLTQARQIAAGATVRIQERECRCHRCLQAEQDDKLEAVMRIVNRRNQ